MATAHARKELKSLFRIIDSRLNARPKNETWERAIRLLSDRLVFNYDLDPLRKFEFFVLFDAIAAFNAAYPGYHVVMRQHYERGRETYNAIMRLIRMQSSDGNRNIRASKVLSKTVAFEDFVRMSRYDRILIQAHIVSVIRHDMDKIYQAMTDAARDFTGPSILNVGDGVPLPASFLFRLINAGILKNMAGTRILTIDKNHSLRNLENEFRTTYGKGCAGFGFKIMDAMNLSGVNEKYDLIMASYMIDDCLDHEVLMSELQRVAKKGGVICVSGHNVSTTFDAERWVNAPGDLHIHQCTPPTLLSIGRRLRMKVIRRRTNEHAYMVVFQKRE